MSNVSCWLTGKVQVNILESQKTRWATRCSSSVVSMAIIYLPHTCLEKLQTCIDSLSTCSRQFSTCTCRKLVAGTHTIGRVKLFRFVARFSTRLRFVDNSIWKHALVYFCQFECVKGAHMTYAKWQSREVYNSENHSKPIHPRILK